MNYTPTAQEQVLHMFPYAKCEIMKGFHSIILKPNLEPIAYSLLSEERAWRNAWDAIINQSMTSKK